MAYRVRILQHPDGSVTIIHPAMNDLARPPGVNDETWVEQCLDKTMAKHPEWHALLSVDIQSDALPTDRALRHKWRLVAGAVMVDPAVPDPSHPKQALLDAIDEAATLVDLKLLMKRIVKDT